MAAYLRIDGLDPEDLDDVDPQLFNDLANGVFAHLNDEQPELFDQHEGVIPVRNPEHDPRLLEATAVYAHRDETVDDGVSDFVFCSFGDDIHGLDAPGYASVEEFAEVQLMQTFDDGREALDDYLPTEAEREQLGDDPVRVGTLYHDGERAVRVDFDTDAFEDGELS
jgi:hypothetical protein